MRPARIAALGNLKVPQLGSDRRFPESFKGVINKAANTIMALIAAEMDRKTMQVRRLFLNTLRNATMPLSYDSPVSHIDHTMREVIYVCVMGSENKCGFAYVIHLGNKIQYHFAVFTV
ncbi:Uncharacterised protein [Escherichia coli]|nr:Uncharacterised protein [Escherichia coli]